MEENTEKITVKLKYDPNKEDMIEVSIKSNATVAALEEKVKETLGNLDNVPMGILKFNEQELDDKNKTLADLDMKDGRIIENENRVVLIKTLTGKTIYITCNENTTVREFLQKLKGKAPELCYIRLVFAGEALQRSMLGQKLLGCQIGKRSINYGGILHLVIPLKANSDTVFDLNNPEESKNSNYPPLRIIVGIADLLLLAAAVATFLLYFLTTLSLSVAVPIVLAALFVVGSVLFFGWNEILPKILPEGGLKKINSGIDPNENDKEKSKNYEKEEKVPSKVNEYEKKI
ncbi:MAG: hypothetical protein IJU86_01800 [Firmicutes bacterium]|nr:hypothetical protein [Bacillota bacterium]